MLILRTRNYKIYIPNFIGNVSKEDLDSKFDSLKSTITQPITPLTFTKTSPIVAVVRQGHTYLYPVSTQ
jgi:hypothetical protein